MTNTPIIMAPMSTAYARVPRSLRGLIRQGITLRHDQIERIASGDWPGGLKGHLLRRRMKAASAIFLDWENEPLGSERFYPLISQLSRTRTLSASTIAHIDHIDPDGHAYFTPAVSLHLDIRGRGFGTPRPDDDRPWTPELVADFARDQIRKGCTRTGLDSVWAFCGVKHTHATTASGKFIPIDLWLSLVNAALDADARVLVFGDGPALVKYLARHKQAILGGLAS